MQVALSYGLPQSRHKTLESMANFYRAVERDVAELPGVRSVGWGSGLPLGGVYYSGFNVTIEGQPGETAANRPAVDYMIVSPGYLDALGVRVLEGRGIEERDTASSTPVALVSSDFVTKHLAGRNPIGVRVTVPMMGLTRVAPVTREIVGVVAPIRPSHDGDDSDQLYVPLTQNAWANSIARRSPPRAASRQPRWRQPCRRRSRGSIPNSRSRGSGPSTRWGGGRSRGRGFARRSWPRSPALALLLAMVGVFGVLAYSVQQRWREFGVRIALGASVGHVLGLVGRAAASVVGVGLVVGLLGAMVLARFVSSFLFGVPPWDVVTFGAVAAVLAVTGAVAALAPALRAARVDPVIAFRND